MRRAKLILSAFALFLSAGVSAYATSVTFDFNTLAVNATAAQIQTYMTTALAASGCAGCSVIVTGAVADQQYNADGNVTGPGSGSKSLTLGDSNGATASNTTSVTNSSYDTFIANTSDSGGQVSSQITIQFVGVTLTNSDSFDYEIFPDITCTSITTSPNCGTKSSPGTGTPSGYANQPDLEFEAGTNKTGTDAVVTTLWGATPVSSGGSDGNAVKSPDSSGELAPQLIGTWSGSLAGDTELDFVDWPATIGIDNLTVSYNTPAVPEPSAIVLFGTLVLFLGKRLRKA